MVFHIVRDNDVHDDKALGINSGVIWKSIQLFYEIWRQRNPNTTKVLGNLKKLIWIAIYSYSNM